MAVGLLNKLPALCAGLSILLLAACTAEQQTGERYQVRGVVEEVLPEYRQAVISHEDIPDFMPAMTMNFDVPDPSLLATLQAGQQIEFTLDFTGKSFRIVAVEILAEGRPAEGFVRLGEGFVRAEPAPSFRLTDQEGRSFTLDALAGKGVLLDFIFTSCPGPCPILTSRQVSVQEAIGAADRERTWFVSISIDPGNDTPEAMKRYAEARGVDLSTWSFLTGSEEEIDAVLEAYGVGRREGKDGSIDHLLVTFVIDGDGRIVERYVGLEDDPTEIAATVVAAAG